MVARGGAASSDLIWLSEAQMRHIDLSILLAHRVPSVDDRRIVSGAIFGIRNRRRWRDARAEYGPPDDLQPVDPLSRLGLFNKIFAAPSAKGGKPGQLMIDAIAVRIPSDPPSASPQPSSSG
jgi:putative transposase